MQAMTSGRLLSGLALASAYFSALAILFRWFARSTRSHVLSLEPSVPKQVVPPTRWRRGFRIVAMVSLAAGLLVGEASALAHFTSALIPGVRCPGGWPPMTGCSLDVTGAASTRAAALAVLSCAALAFGVFYRVSMKSAYQPFAALALGIVAFGATVDLVVGANGQARPQHCFRVIGALQWTAAAGFALGAIILPTDSLKARIGGLLAHIGAASIRALGAVAMLMIWPYLPPASAVAMLVLLLVPGVATALTGAAALSLADASE